MNDGFVDDWAFHPTFCRVLSIKHWDNMGTNGIEQRLMIFRVDFSDICLRHRIAD